MGEKKKKLREKIEGENWQGCQISHAHVSVVGKMPSLKCPPGKPFTLPGQATAKQLVSETSLTPCL